MTSGQNPSAAQISPTVQLKDGAVADIEEHAALPRFEHRGMNPAAVDIDDRALERVVAVGVTDRKFDSAPSSPDGPGGEGLNPATCTLKITLSISRSLAKCAHGALM